MADTNLQGFRPLMGFLNFKYFSNSGTNSANCFRPLMGFLNFKLEMQEMKNQSVICFRPLMGFLNFKSDNGDTVQIIIVGFPSPYGVS